MRLVATEDIRTTCGVLGAVGCAAKNPIDIQICSNQIKPLTDKAVIIDAMTIRALLLYPKRR